MGTHIGALGGRAPGYMFCIYIAIIYIKISTLVVKKKNVYPAYFEQNQADVLDLDKTVIETIQAASHGQSYNELRALLRQFLFKGDAVEKKVENLSGGKRPDYLSAA